MVMLDVGIKVTPGSGVGAASNYWRSHEPRMANQETRDSQGKPHGHS
jgi:alanine-glyoxylate transaminase / serine-glyoxylate transaminase / serine-pyruvate transaminase